MRPHVPIVDLHADLLWRTEVTGKDPWRVCPGEMLDLPRMLEAGPSLQLFTLYTPATHQGPAATAYAERLLGIWRSLVTRGDGKLKWLKTRDDVRGLDPSGLSGLLSMEGASPLDGRVSELDRFYEAGVRSLGLTHNPRNEAADGCMVPSHERRGLTDFGRALVRRSAQLGILLDVAHLAPEGLRDLLDEVDGLPDRVPVVSTHTGCRALTDHPRNLDDDQLRALAATGGLVGITLYPGHIRLDGADPSLDSALDHVEHMIEVCGVEHVGVGADLDGFTGPGLPGGGDTPVCYGLLAEGLVARGLPPEDVASILGGNALRVLDSVLR